ncbi:tRNA (adenosine(37)-N6)-threonylcarbamoyltransferase complex dimerization subunit type 1 TsaB [Fretibacter rubidus]|uniref:tRNA (adenosine(37)-N6)-threonylcarbamoyltransferase complex dimerization subunit type 1 TsaB n=1 Tax=Fretibacter rubidus TaxID=570162 RepID=UPI00352A429D
MIVLGLDTTGSHCACAIVDDHRVLAHISEPMGRGHAERLAPMVAEALALAQLTAADIDRLSVCTGPGSFTGQRVALAFARGFALPRRLPVIGLDALSVKAREIEFTTGDALVGVMRDIRRGQVFYASFSHGRPLSPPRAMTLTEADEEADTLQAAVYDADTVDTRILAWLAIDLSPATHPPVSLYSRAPDAKLPGGIDP